MLGKLIKHEIKNTYKVMLIVYAAYILLTVLGCVSSYNMFSVNSMIPLNVIGIMFYVFSCVGVFIATFIFICIRYYKTMYSAQGYLTHTLPAKGITVFNAKLIVSFIWMFLAEVLLLASIMCFAIAISDGELAGLITSYSWSDINKIFYEEMGMNLIPLLIWMGVASVLGILIENLWIFASFAIGQLVNKGRIPLSIGAAMGMYFIFEFIGIIETLFSRNSVLSQMVIMGKAADEIELGLYFRSLAVSSTIWYVIIGIGLYLTCVLINKKKLNLE